jgi:hypothetical protein
MMALLASLILSGCSDPSWVYSRPNTSDDTRRADYAQCDREREAPSVAFMYAAGDIYRCMKRLGYQQQDLRQ